MCTTNNTTTNNTINNTTWKIVRTRGWLRWFAAMPVFFRAFLGSKGRSSEKWSRHRAAIITIASRKCFQGLKKHWKFTQYIYLDLNGDWSSPLFKKPTVDVYSMCIIVCVEYVGGATTYGWVVHCMKEKQKREENSLKTSWEEKNKLACNADVGPAVVLSAPRSALLAYFQPPGASRSPPGLRGKNTP
jgi:hypothetical protein